MRDRVVIAAAKIVLEPIFEADFSPVSFRAARSGPLTTPWRRSAGQRTGGAMWVLDADIKACFDEIDQDALVAQVERRALTGRC